jgi:hypothetical protein
MEFTPSVFNTFCNQNIIRIPPEDIRNEIEHYDLPQKVKRQLIILSNVIRRYKPDDILTRPFPKDTNLAFLIMCIVSNYRIKYFKSILNADVELLDNLQEQVHQNKLKEESYLEVCTNLKIHKQITEFYANIFFWCASYHISDGNLRVNNIYL